jgi:small basic protein
MWLPLVALVIGFCAVYLPRVEIPSQYSEYIGVALVAGFDSVIGAIRSVIERRFNDRVFVSGFFTNATMAAVLLYLCNALGIRYVALAIIVALMIRIFNNLGFIRRYVVARLFEKRLSSESVFPEP